MELRMGDDGIAEPAAAFAVSVPEPVASTKVETKDLMASAVAEPPLTGVALPTGSQTTTAVPASAEHLSSAVQALKASLQQTLTLFRDVQKARLALTLSPQGNPSSLVTAIDAT